MSYKTLVRPILDYCSSVWDPYTQNSHQTDWSCNKTEQLALLQEITADEAVSLQWNSNNWEPLELRRKVGRLTNFHEAIAGRLAIPVRSALRPAGRNLRHTSTTNSYIPIPANKNCYKFSFIPRTIPEWNQLPNSIAAIQDKTVFKTAAHNHLIKQSNQN